MGELSFDSRGQEDGPPESKSDELERFPGQKSPTTQPRAKSIPRAGKRAKRRFRLGATQLIGPAGHSSISDALRTAAEHWLGCSTGAKASGAPGSWPPTFVHEGCVLAPQSAFGFSSMAVPVVVPDWTQRAPVIALRGEKKVTPVSKQLRSVCSITGRGIMKFTLTSWLLSFALAVLLFSIVSVGLFDRMHASL